MNAARSAMIAALAVSAATVLSSCDPPEDLTVVRALDEHPVDLDALTQTRWVEPDVLIGVRPTIEQVRDEAARMARALDDVPTETAWEITDDVCTVLDVADAATGSPEDVAAFLATRDDSIRSYLVQTVELVSSLQDAATSLDRAVVLARADLCVVAGEMTG